MDSSPKTAVKVSQQKLENVLRSLALALFAGSVPAAPPRSPLLEEAWQAPLPFTLAVALRGALATRCPVKGERDLPRRRTRRVQNKPPTNEALSGVCSYEWRSPCSSDERADTSRPCDVTGRANDERRKLPQTDGRVTGLKIKGASPRAAARDGRRAV